MTDVRVLDSKVPMRDGTLLAADVVVADAEVPRPVLLVRTPYARGAMRLVHDVVGLARSGWAVVVQDVRGRFDSDGCFTPFDQEVDDGYDTVDWCSRQPWSDGRVAMTGWSYVGATQWLAALSRHPALRAINPVVGAGDIADAMVHEGDAFQLGLVQPWTLGLAASDPRASDVDRQRAGDLGARWSEVLAAPPGADPVAELLPTYRAWRQRTAAPSATVGGRYEELDVAAFQVAGWYDVFCESALRHWVGLADSGRPQRLVIGPWSHTNGLSNLHPEVDFGGEANGVYGGVLGSALDWMRRAVVGEQVPTGISIFVMGDGWRELQSWPPPAADLVLHLGEGRLQPGPDASAAADLLRHDPLNPVPTWGGRVLGPFLPMAGPVDQRPVESRDDVLVYTSEPLDEPLTVIGEVRARIRVATSGRSLDVVAKLCDVHPDGRSLNVVDSVRRCAAEPGVPHPVDVVLGSTAYRFAAGSRLRLQVAASNFPRFDVNPSTGEPPGTARALLPAEHTVHRGGSSGSCLVLPVTS